MRSFRVCIRLFPYPKTARTAPATGMANHAEILRYIDSIARDKEIDKEALIEGIEHAMSHALAKKYGVDDVEITLNRETGEFDCNYEVSMEDQGRIFVIKYFLADDTMAAFEPPQKNSGVMGGKFIQRTRTAAATRPWCHRVDRADYMCVMHIRKHMYGRGAPHGHCVARRVVCVWHIKIALAW